MRFGIAPFGKWLTAPRLAFSDRRRIDRRSAQAQKFSLQRRRQRTIPPQPATASAIVPQPAKAGRSEHHKNRGGWAASGHTAWRALDNLTTTCILYKNQFIEMHVDRATCASYKRCAPVVDGGFMQDSAVATEVDRNFEQFRLALPQLLVKFPGKFVVMHRGSAIDAFDSVGDAVEFGIAKFGGLSEFSVQEVTAKAGTLGHYTYAVHNVPQ